MKECNSELAAAIALGYTKISWENKIGIRKQPSSADKDWDELTDRELEAAERLGYTRKMWEKDKEPAAMKKGWDELTSCGDGHDCQPLANALAKRCVPVLCCLPPSLS